MFRFSVSFLVHIFFLLLFNFLYIKPPLLAQSFLEKSEASIGKSLQNYRLVNQKGQHFPFYSLKGKVVLITFMYINCPDMCVLTGISLQNLLEELPHELREEFLVLSISINPKQDTPEKLLEYGERFTDNFKSWIFATTEEETLEMLIRDTGFTYKKNRQNIEHLNRITLINQESKVVKHFYGTDFDNKEIIRDIKTLSDGGMPLQKKIKSTVNLIKLYCSNYDPVSKTYKLDYGFIISSLFQILFVFITVFFLIRFLGSKKSRGK